MSATRDEVLLAMAEAVDSGVQQALRDYGISDEVIGADVERFAASLTTASYALAAAEQSGWVLVPASEHKRLSDRVAALDEPYVDDRGEHWRAPTAHAYAAVCKALRTCKAERDAARAAAPKVWEI